MAPASKHALDLLNSITYASPKAGLNRARGTEPTSIIKQELREQNVYKLQIELDCHMRYCGSKHYCTLSLVFGIVWNIILCKYKEKNIRLQKIRMSQFSMRKFKPRIALY